MANFQLKGIQLTTGQSSYDKDVIYFVRTSGEQGNGLDGYIYFNNKKYGTAAGVDSALKALIGDLTALTTSEETSIVSAINSLVTDIAGVSGATKSNTDAIGILTGDTGTTGSVDQKIKTAIEDLDSTITGDTTAGDNNYVAEVTETDGKVTVKYATLPTEKDVTATGDTLISASATGHAVTVAATDDLTTAVNNANTAVQTVNSKAGTAVTLNSDDVKIGTAINYSSTTVADTGLTVTQAISAVTEQMVKNEETTAASLNALNSGLTAVSGLTLTALQTASGDDLVSATKDGTEVKVAATDDLKTAVTNANNAVQSVNSKTGTTVTLNSADIQTSAAITDGTNEKYAAGTTVESVLSSLTKTIADNNKSSFVDVQYSSNTIYLLSNDGTTVSTGFNADAFIKDGMLSEATLVTEKPATKEGESATSGQFIKFTWNTDAGKSDMYVDVTTLVDVYTADEQTLTVSSNQFSAKTDVDGGVASYSGLTLVSATTYANQTGITLLNDTVDTEGSVAYKINQAITALTATTTGSAGVGKYVSQVTETDGKVSVTYSDLPTESDIAITGSTLVTASATGHNITLTDSDDLTTAVANANSAVQSATGDTLVSATAADNKITVAATDDLTTAVANANSAVQSATGDTYVSATAADNKITVAATTGLTTAVANANSAVQSVNGETGTTVTINAGEITLGSDITSGETTIQSSTATVSTTLSDIYAKIAKAAQTASIASTGKTITITTGDTGNNVEVNLEKSTTDTVAAGHVEITKNNDGALYGVMYYGGDDVVTEAESV